MKTQIKRLLGLLMAMVMVFTMLPVGIIAGATETEEEAYYLLEEEFDDASVLTNGDWVTTTTQGASYAVTDGKLVTSSTKYGPVVTYGKGYNWTDYELTTTLETSDGGWNRIDFRKGTDGKSCYSLYWQNGKLYIRKYDSAGKYYYGSLAEPPKSEEPYVVTVNCVGNVITYTIKNSSYTKSDSWTDNGNLTINGVANTPVYYSGTVGFAQQEGTTDAPRSKHYDYMIVKDLRERANVTFNVNGTETTQSVAVGETPVAPEVTETVRFDAEGNRYTFTGWDKELAAVESTDPVTYTAQYDKDQLLVDESFGSEDALKNWNFTGGEGTTLAVADGKLVLTSGDSQGYAYYKYGYNWADYEFTATYDTNNTWNGPVFRVSEDGNSYYAVMMLNAAARVRKYTGKQYTEVATFGITDNSTFDLTVKVVGNTMSFYVDGVLKTLSTGETSYTDTTDPYTTGSFGFYGIASQTSYLDNVKVYNLGEDVELHTCVFDQEVAEDKYLATSADCDDAATYYYSCTCGEAGTETFSYGDSTGHNWVNGECANDCGTECAEHTWDNGVCSNCKLECGHQYTHDCDAECNTCGAIRQVDDHVDANPKDHVCDICTEIVGTHADGDDDNHTCDYCGKPVDGETCVDGDDKDHNCDECGAENVSEHEYYADCDASCNICDATRTPPKQHNNSITSDADQHIILCGDCGNRTVEDHADNDDDHLCDVCDRKLSDHSWNAQTGKCDICQADCEHKWGDWFTDEEAGCTKNGSKHRTCATCAMVETQAIEASHILGYESGHCPRCEEKYPDAVTVAKNGDKEYAYLPLALLRAESGDTITLMSTINLDTAGVTVNKNLTIDLNGQTVNSLGDVFVCTAGTLTITGEGDINAETDGAGTACAVWANGGTVIIDGGTWSCGGDSTTTDVRHQNDVIYVGESGGTIVVKSGYFEYTENVWTLNVNDNHLGSLKVYGGTFENFDPSNSAAQAKGDPSFVAEGYTVEEADGVYTVKELPGKVATNTRFDEELSLIVYYDFVTSPKDAGYVAKLEKDDQAIELENWAVDSDGDWAVELTGISAKEIADVFTITVYDGNTAITKSQEVSLRDYAIAILDNESKSAEYKTAMMDMLNYGAEAQKKFNYNTGNPANAGLDKYQTHATVTMDAVTNDRNIAIGEIFDGSSVRFNDAINILFWFKGITLDTYAEFTWENNSGVACSHIVYSNEYQVDGDSYVIELAGKLDVADARKNVKCVIKNTADDTEVITVIDSVSSNVARVLAKDGSTYKDLYESFMKYADATKVYLDSKNQ